MMDSGGSTGRLRDQLGVLPPGDLRQALVALSSSPKIWRDLFTYRFDAGDMQGHNFGNIFLSALEKITGSIETAIEMAQQILGTKGAVIPVTLEKCQLCARLVDNTIIESEALIDEVHVARPKIATCYLKPSALPNHAALTAITEADYIIFGPGDLYTSIIPNLLVTGIASTIRLSRARKIYILNLMTKFGQTEGCPASFHVNELEKYLGGACLDYILINSQRPAQELLDWYTRSGDVQLVLDDLASNDRRVVRTDLLDPAKYEALLADRLKRSLIRHDPEKVAEVLMGIFETR